MTVPRSTEGSRIDLVPEPSLVDPSAGRDAMLADGVEQGVVEGYRRLDDLPDEVRAAG